MGWADRVTVAAGFLLAAAAAFFIGSAVGYGDGFREAQAQWAGVYRIVKIDRNHYVFRPREEARDKMAREYFIRVEWLHNGSKFPRDLTTRVEASNVAAAIGKALRNAKKNGKGFREAVGGTFKVHATVSELLAKKEEAR